MTQSLPRAVCTHCNGEFTYYQRHSGFGDEGYMYCDSDETVLTMQFYGATYQSIMTKLPWTLNEGEKQVVEAALKPCPFGGRFSFRNPPRCPHCFEDVSAVVPGGIYYVVTGRRVDADRDHLWRQG